jgi:hypothetical protein
MSETYRWTSFVYGRSYQVDFSSIATPASFTAQDTQWALQYITATTKSADKLAGNPRWSLFRNENYCVVGVTCMVKDLLGERASSDGSDMTKDCQGRPLYIFVGYVAQLENQPYLFSVPPYLGNDLELFAPLYQHVRNIWYIKEYEKFNKLPILTNERELSYSEFPNNLNYDRHLAQQLNHQHKNKHSDRVFLWQDSEENRKKLWSTAARSKFPTSLCLGFKSEFDAISSPFLNGTARSVDRLRVANKTSKTTAAKNERSLPELVRGKVKDDLKVTIEKVEKAVEAGQEIVQSLTNKSESSLSRLPNRRSNQGNTSEFGFKAKKKVNETYQSDTKEKKLKHSENQAENWF